MTSPAPSGARSCSELCEASGEPLVGSAGAASMWVGVAWPKPLWDPGDVAMSEGLPAAMRGLAGEAAAAGHKLALRLFQRHPRADHRAVELLLYHARHLEIARDVPTGELPERIRAFVRGARSADAAAGARPQLLVCTDGRHDPCCAVRGWPLFLALRDAASRLGGAVEVAECSHLGGHRFAGSCLALPSGMLLGRVPPSDAAAIVAAVADDAPLLCHVRGRIGRSELEQLAEAWVRERLASDVQVEVGRAEPAGTDRARVDVAVHDGPTFSLICVRRVFVPAVGGDSPCEEVKAQARWVVERGTES